MAQQLLQKYSVRKKKGELLFCEFEPGATLFFILEGKARLTKIISGREKTLAIFGKGNIFGEMAILENMPRSATCIAESALHCLELNLENFLILVKSQPVLGVKLLSSIAERIMDQKRKLQILQRVDQEGKVMDTLLMLHEKKRSTPISEEGVQIKITPQEIASWTGLSPEECANTLEVLSRSNKIQLRKEAVIIKSVESARILASRKRSTL